MVYLKVKKSETDVFLFEAKHDLPLDQVIRECTQVHNQRVRLLEIIHHVKDLVQYGPMRPLEQQGLDEDTIEIEEIDEDEEGTSKGKEAKNKDPSARRVGIRKIISN
jgi:hypothetical protein